MSVEEPLASRRRNGVNASLFLFSFFFLLSLPLSHALSSHLSLTLQRLADDALALVLAALLALERLAVEVLAAEAGVAAQHFASICEWSCFPSCVSLLVFSFARFPRAGYYAIESCR